MTPKIVIVSFLPGIVLKADYMKMGEVFSWGSEIETTSLNDRDRSGCCSNVISSAFVVCLGLVFC